MKIKLLFALTISFFINIQAQEIPSSFENAAPESVGFSSDRLDKIGEMLEYSIEKQQIPGAVALVAKDGKIVYHKAFGNANSEGEKLEKDDPDAVQEPAEFVEPGIFLIKPDGTLYASSIQTMPFARPPVDGMVTGIRWFTPQSFPSGG